MRANEFLREDDNQYISIGFNDEQAARRAIQVFGENSLEFENLGYDDRGVTSLRLHKRDASDTKWALDNNHIPYSISLTLSETTTAGGMAVGAIGGLGPAITRNASIYGNPSKKKKKKKSGKYMNSKDSD